MSQPVFENHGKAALVYSDPTQLSGRYFSQKADERNIIADIIKTMAPIFMSVSVSLKAIHYILPPI